MTPGLDHAATVSPIGDGRYAWDLPDGWQQGRGAFGGLVLGTLVRAMEDTVGDATRPLRSLTGDLCAPALAGPSEIVVTTLRRGRGMTYLDARLMQQGEVVARAGAAFAASRAVETPSVPMDPPRLPPWQSIDRLFLGPPAAPVFAPRYVFRPVGALPFTAAAEPVCLGWVQEDPAPAALSTASVVGLMDAWWPAHFMVLNAPRPSATVTFTLELLTDPATLDPSQPLAYRSRVAAARDGYSVEFRELWSGDRPVALNQQTFALLG